MTSIQFLIPIYNEECNIKLLANFLSSIYKEVTNNYNRNIDWSITFSDNCSIDNSLSELSKVKFFTSKVSIIPFAQNYGYSYATSYLLHVSKGEYLVLIPSDMQIPRETIVNGIINSLNSDRSVFFCRKNQESKMITHGLILYLKKIFYALLNIAQNNTYKGFYGMGCFSANDIFFMQKNNNQDFSPYQLRLVLPQICYKPIQVYFKEKKRLHGKSGFSFFTYVKEAFSILLRSSFIYKNGIQSLFLIVFFGFILLSIFILTIKIFQPLLILPGFTTVILLLLFSSMLNVLAIYLLWLKIEAKNSYLSFKKPILKRKIDYLK